MPKTTRTPTQGDETEPSTEETSLVHQFFRTVVDVASKSAESSTAAATALRNLEMTTSEVKTEVGGVKTELMLAKAEVATLVRKVDELDKKLNGSGFLQGFVDALKNPQTIALLVPILISVIAGILGLRYSLPTEHVPTVIVETPTEGHTP